MPRKTTAKPLTEEQRKLASNVEKLVNYFVSKNPRPRYLTPDDYRAELYLAVVRRSSQFDPKKGTFDTWAYRAMEQRLKGLHYAAYQKATYRVGKERHFREVRVFFVDAKLFDVSRFRRIDGVYYGSIRNTASRGLRKLQCDD